MKALIVVDVLSMTGIVLATIGALLNLVGLVVAPSLVRALLFMFSLAAVFLCGFMLNWSKIITTSSRFRETESRETEEKPSAYFTAVSLVKNKIEEMREKRPPRTRYQIAKSDSRKRNHKENAG